MASQGVTTDGVLMAAREAHGVGTLGDIEHAVLESGGGISIILRPATSRGVDDQPLSGTATCARTYSRAP